MGGAKPAKQVPAKWGGPQGPVIGTATVRETAEGIEVDMEFDTSTPEGREMQDLYMPRGSFSVGR